MAEAKPIEDNGQDVDRDLIQRMARKDSQALDAFYERHRRLAFSLVFRIVGNREDAEDVLVDVFWQAWLQAERYDESRGKVLAWLLTIARTRALDRRRAQRRVPNATEEPIEPVAAAAPDPSIAADRRDAVQAALSALPEQQRIPLELAFFDGMTHTEIASTLQQPLGTVKDRIRNGMMHLRKRLKAYL